MIQSTANQSVLVATVERVVIGTIGESKVYKDGLVFLFFSLFFFFNSLFLSSFAIIVADGAQGRGERQRTFSHEGTELRPSHRRLVTSHDHVMEIEIAQ